MHAHRPPYRARLRGLCVLVALAALGVTAHAQVTLSKFPPNPGVMPGGGWQWSNGSNWGDPTPPRAWVGGKYGSVPTPGVQVTDPFTLQGKAGPLSGFSRTTALLPAIAGALGRCLGNLICGAAATAAAVYAAEQLRARPMEEHPGIWIDPGQMPEEVDGYLYGIGATGECSIVSGGFGSALEAWTCVFDQAKASLESGVGRYVVVQQAPTCAKVAEPATYTCTYRMEQWRRYESGAVERLGSADATYTVAGQPSRTNRCPASIDPLNPAYNVPEGGPTGPDGKCPTARYNWRPGTPEEVAQRMRDHPPPEADLPDIVRGIVEDGGQDVPASITSEGPASQVGEPRQTTTTSPGPGGSPQTTIKTETTTYNYKYEGDKITYNTSVRTTITNNDGDVISEETGEQAPPEDPTDPCEFGRDRLGCIKLGDPPDEEIPKDTRDLDFAHVDLGMGGGCPPPVALPNGQVISYQPLCDGLTKARPVVIGIGLLIAAGIIAAALRA